MAELDDRAADGGEGDAPDAAAAVVVGCDGSDRSDDAVALAARLALSLGAELILAAAAPGIPPPPSGGIRDDELGRATDPVLRSARQMLARLPTSPPARARALAEPAAHALVDVARSEDAGLIVVGPTHRGSLGRVLPGSTGRRVIAESPVPVAVAPSGYATASANGSIERLCVAVDDSEEGEAASAVALALADRIGAEAPREVTPELDGLRTVDPEDVDLMVIGTHGHGPVASWLTGSATSEIASLARWPLLVVAPSMSAVGG